MTESQGLHPSRVDAAQLVLGLGSDGIVGGDVWVPFWVGRDVLSIVEIGSGFAGLGRCGGNERAPPEVGSTDGLAVPACAFAVDLAAG